MTFQFCDCCRGELLTGTARGTVAIPQTLYEYLAGRRAAEPTVPRMTPEWTMARMLGASEATEDIRLEVCGECLRGFVVLRELVLAAAQRGAL